MPDIAVSVVEVNDVSLERLVDYLHDHATEASHTRLDAQAILGGDAPAAVSLDGEDVVGAAAFRPADGSPGRRLHYLHADTSAHLRPLVDWVRSRAGQSGAHGSFGVAAERATIEALEALGARRGLTEYYLERDPLPTGLSDLVPTGVEVRPLDDQRRGEFVALWRAAYSSYGPVHLTEEDIRRDLAGDDPVIYLQAMIGGRLVGTARGDIWDGTGWFGCLAVVADQRGRGIGRGLLRAAGRWATDAGATRISLGVDAHNRDALRLYLDEGYEVQEESLQLHLDPL